MKNPLIGLISLLCSLIPSATSAQTNILKAFDAIIDCPGATITESHLLDRNPATGIKSGQSDVYKFVLPADKSGLIDKVVAAFKQDSEKSYSYVSGSVEEEGRSIALAIGDTGDDGVALYDNYVYALFLAPLSEDSEGKYRYAYGMDYEKKDGKIEGKLIVTYATTLRYRQKSEQARRDSIFRQFNGAYVINAPQTQHSPFEKIMTYIQGIATADTQTRISLATKIYQKIVDSPDMPASDKDVLREILMGMLNEKKYSEVILNRLLNQSLIELK